MIRRGIVHVGDIAPEIRSHEARVLEQVFDVTRRDACRFGRRGPLEPCKVAPFDQEDVIEK